MATKEQMMMKFISTVVDEDATVTEYACDFNAKCDGTSIWMDTTGLTVHVTGINVFDEGDYKMVSVAHDGPWQIYTDRGFEREISERLGFDVAFTEQGMQDEGLASMETC